MLRRFIGALTRGGAGGMPRPIEMHAHDPRRFISDMLAWVHQVGALLSLQRPLAPLPLSCCSGCENPSQDCRLASSPDFKSGSSDGRDGCGFQALASERELLVALFGGDAREGAAGQVEEAVSPRSRPPDMPSTSALLDQVFESICRPLKVLPYCIRASSPWLPQIATELQQMFRRLTMKFHRAHGDKILESSCMPLTVLS